MAVPFLACVFTHLSLELMISLLLSLYFETNFKKEKNFTGKIPPHEGLEKFKQPAWVFLFFVLDEDFGPWVAIESEEQGAVSFSFKRLLGRRKKCVFQGSGAADLQGASEDLVWSL